MPKDERLNIKVTTAQYNYLNGLTKNTKLTNSKLLLEWVENTVPTIVASKQPDLFTKFIHLRLTPQQKKDIVSKAKSYSLNASDLFRHIIFTRIQKGKTANGLLHVASHNTVEGLRILIAQEVTDGNMAKAKDLIVKWETLAINLDVNDINWAHVSAARGTIARFERKLDQALHHLTRALKIAKMQNEKVLISSICAQLGNLFGLEEKHETAIDYFEQAIDHLDPIDFADHYIRAYMGLCIQNAYLGNTMAIERYIKRLVNLAQFKEIKTKAHYLNRLGWLNTKLGKYDLAAVNLLEALKLALAQKNIYELYYIYENIGILHLQQMNFELAAKNLAIAKEYDKQSRGKTGARINILICFMECINADLQCYYNLEKMVLHAVKDGNKSVFRYLLFTAAYLFYPDTKQSDLGKKGLEELAKTSAKLVSDAAIYTLQNKVISRF